MRLGTWVAEHGVDAPGPYRAGRDLLLHRTPRPGAEVAAGEDTLAAARGWVVALDHSVLPIQGPPGAGKTYTGARMITWLVRAGKKVGITALSHKVIRNLLEEVVKAAEEERTPVRCAQKVTDASEEAHASIVEITDNAAILDEIQSGAAQVAAGTAWLWAREEFFESVDVLFVDEAGQLTLADVLAVSPAARSLVLLGDPQQLGQPLQGSHPEGTDVSALEHLLDGHKTILPAAGPLSRPYLAASSGDLRLHVGAFLRRTAEFAPQSGPSGSRRTNALCGRRAVVCAGRARGQPDLIARRGRAGR